MRLSELIKSLQEEYNRHGDCNVYYYVAPDEIYRGYFEKVEFDMFDFFVIDEKNNEIAK